MLLVQKPSGATSHDVVAVARRQTRVRRIGHTGTLDPMAEGLLVLLVGAATKHQQALQAHEKTYEATLALGVMTDTGDAEGRRVREAPVLPVDGESVSRVFNALVGPLEQTPPQYSAVKVRGRPSYWWARRGKTVTLRPRTVQIFELRVKNVTPMTIAFRLHCSAGTYVRTLAELIAQRLGTVGHLTALTRRRVGPWTLDEAVTFDWLKQADAEAIASRLLPLEQLHARVRWA